MNTDLRNDYVDLATPHRRLACRLWAHGRPNHWRFTVSVRDRSGAILVFATGGPDDVAPRIDRNDDGSRSLWLRSACVELRGETEAKAAERFIAQHAPDGARQERLAQAMSASTLQPQTNGDHRGLPILSSNPRAPTAG